MQLNNKTKIISDKDIIVTNGSNIGKSLSEVLDKQNDDISNLKSNVKYIYTHGGVGNGSSGGSGSGSSSSTWDATVMLGGKDITSESSVIFTTPGQYPLYVRILRANNGTYSIKYKTECGDAEDAMSEKANSFDNLYIFEATVNLSTNKQSISVIIEDDIGTMKVIKCMYIVNPLVCDFRLYRGNGTTNESLDGGMLLLSGDGITSHSDSPYIEFEYNLGVATDNIYLTLNFGNYLNTSKIEDSYTTTDDLNFFNPNSYTITPNETNGSLKLMVNDSKQSQGTIKLYLNDIVSAIGIGKGESMLNPKNSAKYTITANFYATSTIGAMERSINVSFTSVPENVFMVAADSSEITHYFTEYDVSKPNGNGDTLASNKSLWTKKENSLYVYNALTVGDSLTSNVKVYEGKLLSDPKTYIVNYTLTPSYNSFDSTDMMMNLNAFKEAYLKTSNHSEDDNVISQLYEKWYREKFYADHLNNFDNIIWMDGKVYNIKYTYKYNNDITELNVDPFEINANFNFTAEDGSIQSSMGLTEQQLTRISISTIQTLGLHKVEWSVGGQKNTSNTYNLTYYIYVKPKPESVNWLLESIYNTVVTSSSSTTSMRISSHYYNLYPDNLTDSSAEASKISNLNCNKTYNGFGTKISKISTRSTDTSSIKFTPTNAANKPTNYDTIISFSMRYSDLNNEDTKILSINYGENKDITFRKNYVFAENNKICIPSDKIGDENKKHLIQLVNHCIWSDNVCKENAGKYITVIYIDGVADNAYNLYTNAPMNVNYIELLPCDVDYDLIDIEYYKPLVIHEKRQIKVLDEYIEAENKVTVKDDTVYDSRDILEMFMYHYWIRYNTSYNGKPFDDTFDQTLSGNGVLDDIIFDGGRIKINNFTTVSTIAEHSEIPTLVLSLDYKTSNANGYIMDRLQAIPVGSSSNSIIANFGECVLYDIYWSTGNGNTLKSQSFKAENNDDFETPVFYFKLQGSSTLNNRAKNLELGIRDRLNNENQQVLFSPNYNAEDSSTFLPEQKWTLKTDVADSAHANNTSIGKFVNAVTESPKRGTGKDDIKHLKNCLEGIPIMVYLMTNSGTELQEINYLGMFNFNLGRNSEYNLGYNTADNTKEMIESIKTSENGFSYAFVHNITREDELVVAEISGNESKFDFSQWNDNILFDPEKEDNSGYMYGDVVNYDNIQTIKNMNKQVSLAGRYIFQQLGRHFNDGWNDTENEGYRSVDDNGNTYVNGFKHQYKFEPQSNKYELDKDDNGNEKLDTAMGKADDLYELITDIPHEPTAGSENREDLANANGAMLDFTSLSEYYTIAIAFGMVDSVLKNLNIKSWNGRTCYCQFYDMDCANGEDNAGLESIEYNIAMDYWTCVKSDDNTVEGINIQFDYWPSSDNKNATAGFDFPSHYLFAVAKYARQIMKNIGDDKDAEGNDKNETGIRVTQKYPQQFWAMLRCIPDETVLNTEGQKKYGKAHGELRSAEYFVNKYFKSGLGSMSKLFVNLNYDYKYFYRDGIVDGSTVTSNGVGLASSFHGTRQYKVKEWLDKRFHFLDAMFQLDAISLIAGQKPQKTFSSIDDYNNYVGDKTWSSNPFELSPYKSYFDNDFKALTYVTKENTFFVNSADIVNNDDVIIQSSAFHIDDIPNQLLDGWQTVTFKCKPSTLLTIINGERATRYMLTDSANSEQKIKIEENGRKRLSAYGSKAFTWLDDINAFLAKNTIVISNNLSRIKADAKAEVESFLINAPMCTEILLNNNAYNGFLQFEQSSVTDESGVEITKSSLEDMELLKTIDISNTSLVCVSESNNYFDGANKCSLETLKINGVQNATGVIKVTNMPKLTTIDISGTTIRPTILNKLSIDCIRGDVDLQNTQIDKIYLKVADDCKNKDIKFTINSDSAVRSIELVGFKEVAINTCQKLESLIIRDDNNAQDMHKLSRLTINNYKDNVSTYNAVTSISKDYSSIVSKVFDLSHLENLQKLELNQCYSMSTLILPGHVIDMTESNYKFYRDINLKYIKGNNGYGIYVNDNNTFSNFFQEAPITMFESDSSTDKILSNIYLGTKITTSNNTWNWGGTSFSMSLAKYILDNLFKDRYSFTEMEYDSNGKITTKSKVTKVDDGIDYRSKMISICFYYKHIKYTINQAETDYKTCNATDGSDINKGVKYKKRNLTTFECEEFTVGNETDTDIADKNTTQSINGTNLVRPYMEAYVNLSNSYIFPTYSDYNFPGKYDGDELKKNACIYTKGLLSYGKEVKSLSTGLPMHYSKRSATSNTVIYNFMLDSFENIGAKITTFKLNDEDNYYPTARFWKYDTTKKELVQIDETISLSDFFETLPNITTLSHFNLYSGQKFSFKNAFNGCKKLNDVSALCYYVSLSNISDIDELFKSCPIIKCKKIFTEGNNIDDESVSPFGTTLNGKSNTGNKTSYTGGRINIATFFNYDTKNIQYLLNADTNKSAEVCMPIPRYVTYSDFVGIWDKLTKNSQKSLTRVDNLFANTVILMPNGSYTFNINKPCNVTCNSEKYSLVLGSDSSDDIPIFTNLTSARHLFDNFEMWYIKSYSEDKDASVALKGFTNNTIKTIGVNGNDDLGATNSELSNLKCKLPIYTKTRTFTAIKNGNAVIARDEKNAFLHKLRTVTDYAYAFRNFYFYKMLSYDFFSKRDKYDDAKASQDYYSYYEVPNQYSDDGTQKSSEAIYYKKDDSTGNLSVITDDSYKGARYQWGEATVLSYNYNGKVDGSNTVNKIKTLYRCFERTNFYYNSSDETDSSKVMLNSQTFVPGDDNTYESFNNPNCDDFDATIVANSYLGDRVLQASNFKITYEYDGDSKSDTFTSPYTRSKNPYPHKICGNKSSLTISNDSTTWIIGLNFEKGIPGASDSYDRLDSFYVKSGDETPYVITETPNDTGGEVFKIYSNKKNYKLGTDLINKAKTISNAYVVYSIDDYNNTNKYYYILNKSSETLSGKFDIKSDKNNDGALKTSKKQKGIRYAMYDWTSSTLLNDNYILLSDGKKYKYYTNPTVVYKFANVTNDTADLWYVDNSYIQVTNEYTQNNSDAPSYSWDIKYKSNSLGYSGSIKIDDVMDGANENTLLELPKFNTSVLNDINSGLNPVFSKASASDITIESVDEYLIRVKSTTPISTSNPASTNRITANPSKHFIMDEIKQTYDGDEAYLEFVTKTYNTNVDSLNLTDKQKIRSWICNICKLSGYAPEYDDYEGLTVSIESDNAKKDSADCYDEEFTSCKIPNSISDNGYNDFLLYFRNKFKDENNVDNLNYVTYSDLEFTLPTLEIAKYFKDGEWVGAKYKFSKYAGMVTCYGPKRKGTDYVYTENGSNMGSTTITKDDLFKKKVIDNSTTITVSTFSSTDNESNLMTNGETEISIPVRYRQDKYYYCTYVFEEFTYTKESSIEKDTSYMDNVNAHIQLVGTTNNDEDNVIFGTPTYAKDDTDDEHPNKIKKTGSVYYKVDCGVIYNYPIYNETIYYKDSNNNTLQVTAENEGGYYICPPDLFRGCKECDLRFVFSYTNAIGALHPDLLYNMKNVSISHWFRDVNILPQYIGHNTHVKQYTFIPSGFNLSGDLSYAFDFRYRLPKTYNPVDDNGGNDDFNKNSEYFIVLKDSFALSKGYANVSSLICAFSGKCYVNRYKREGENGEWSNSDTIQYDYQPIKYISTETGDYRLKGYNSHLYLCGSKEKNCYVPKGLPISLIGKTITLDNMISGTNNVASYFMGPVFDSSVHGEDIKNNYFKYEKTTVIKAPNSLLHPSVELPVYTIAISNTTVDTTKYGRIILVYGKADDERYNLIDPRAFISAGTLGGTSISVNSYKNSKASWVSVSNNVHIIRYYTDEGDALNNGAYYNFVVDNDEIESNLAPSSFYSDCHND
jgi:hypothetical protein